MSRFLRNIAKGGFRVIVLLLIASITAAPFTRHTNALGACQKDVADNGSRYYDCSDGQTCNAEPSSVGSDNQDTAFKYFIERGLTPQQSAGIVGNLIGESEVDPHRFQEGGGPGRGIVQWEVGGRWDIFLKFAEKTNRQNTGDADFPIYDLFVQLDFIWYELNHGYKGVLNDLHTKATPEDAATLIMQKYEIPKDRVSGGKNDKLRRGYAREVYSRYGGDLTPTILQDGGATPTDLQGDEGDTGDAVPLDDCGSTVSSDCTNYVSGTPSRAAILCEARRFDPWGYAWGGGHGDPEAFMKAWEAKGGFDTTNHPFEKVVDCSGLITVALWNVYKVKVSFTTYDVPKMPGTFKEIPFDNAEPGDFAWRYQHIEIISSAGAKSTFGAHGQNGYYADHPDDQISERKKDARSSFTKVYRYIGPGAQQ